MFRISIKKCFETCDLDPKYQLMIGEHAIAKAVKHLGFSGMSLRQIANRVLHAARGSALLHIENTDRYEHLRYMVIRDSRNVPISIVIPVIFDPERDGYVIKTLLIDTECLNQAWMGCTKARNQYRKLERETLKAFSNYEQECDALENFMQSSLEHLQEG